MPQPPFLIDQVDIEPGSVGTRRINRDAGTGGLAFVDPVVSGALTLVQLAGLRNVSNVFVVGTAGDGAAYTTIQAALDAVPAAASAANPYIILVMPGRYDEDLVIARDGVHLIGIGQPELRSALEATPDAVGNDHTITINNSLGTPPQFCLIQGVKISNAHTGKACLRVVGGAASTLIQTEGLFLLDVDMRADSAGGNYSLWASAVNRITVEGCTFAGTNALSALLLQEVSRSIVRNSFVFNGIQCRYDTAEDTPAGGGGNFFFQNCPDLAVFSALVPAISVDCDGSGSSTWHNCTVNAAPQMQFSGDRTHYIRNSVVGELNLLETVALETVATKHDSITAANAAAVLDLDVQRGTANLAAAATVAVTFDIPMSDDDYVVDLELPSRPANDEVPWITLKGASGFTINFNSAQTMTVEWRVTRR